MKKHYHDYQIISQTETAIVEVCKECKNKLVTRADKKGRIDNVRYREEHARDIAQPYGRTKHIFEKYYGKRR